MKYYLVVVMTLLLLSVSTLISNIPLVKSDSQVLFFDDFNYGNANGWTHDLGSWSVVNGEYFVSVGYDNAISTVNQINLTDCIIETKLRFSDTGVGYKACVVFRYSDNVHYYGFEISCMYDSVALTKYTPANPVYGEEFNSTGAWGYQIEPNTDYLLKVIAQGSFFRCFINGTEVISGNDNSYSIGKVGLFASVADAFFDNFKVSSVENYAPATPVGGYSIQTTGNIDPLATHLTLISVLAIAFTTIKRRTRKTKKSL